MFNKFFRMLLSTDAIIINRDGVSYTVLGWSQDELSEYDKDVVFSLKWDDEAYDYWSDINRKSLENATFDEETHFFRMIDTEGLEVGVKLCVLAPLVLTEKLVPC